MKKLLLLLSLLSASALGQAIPGAPGGTVQGTPPGSTAAPGANAVGSGLSLQNGTLGLASQNSGTLLGTPIVPLANVAISGTAGQFSCSCIGVAVGQSMTILGGYGGTGSIVGYSDPTTYYVSATDGVSTFTLQTTARAPIVTTAGTPTGLEFLAVAAVAPIAMGSQQLLNIKSPQFAGGAKYDGEDDTPAYIAAVNAASLMAVASPFPTYGCVYFPAGAIYLNSATPAFPIGTPGCLRGDGSGKTIVRFGPNFSGDFLAWSEAWNQFGGLNISGVTPSGPTVTGFTFIGYKNNAIWPASTVVQNLFNFYDEDEFINVNDVTSIYMSGYTIRCGVLKNDSAAFCRESTIPDLRIFKGGNTATPVPNILLSTDCNSGCTQTGIDSTNQMKFPGLRVYAPQGVGLAVVNNRAAAPTRKVHLDDASFEGDPADQSGAARTGCLVQIGDASLLGTESDILGVNTTFVAPYTGSYALCVNGTAALQPFGIDFPGTIIEHGAGGGGGVSILSGRQIHVQSTVWNTSAVDINVGPASGGVAYPITIDYGGLESTLNKSIDPTSVLLVQRPAYQKGLWAASSAQLLCQSNAAVNSGSTTTEVNLASCPIPAGAMGTNATLRVEVMWSSAATAVAKQAIVRYSVAAGITGTAYLSQAMTTSDALAQSLTIIRENNAASSQIGYPIGFTPYSAGTATAAVTSTINTANASTININCSDASSNGTTETCGIAGYKVFLEMPP